MLENVEAIINRLIQEVQYPKAVQLFSTLSGGKRLRARLILMIAPNHSDAALLGAIVELIHAASLLHDDVIDEAMVRRGNTSVNATHGSKMAIMLGDILYSKAFSELTRFDPKIAHAISQSVTKLSVGEMMDVEMAEVFNSNRQEYLTMLYLKTATLIEVCAYSAAVLANKDANMYAAYGKNLGLAFQIVDDILDVVGDEKMLGKPAMNDFVEGKSTLPYIDLYGVLNGEDQKKLIELHKKVLDDDEKQWIRVLMESHNIIQKSYNYAQTLCDDAIECVPHEEALRAIISNVIARDH